MITKYNQYIKESLLDKLVGPSDEEILDNLKDNPNKLLNISIQNNFLNGINIALNNGADINRLSIIRLSELYRILNYTDEEIINKTKDIRLLLNYGFITKNINIIRYAILNIDDISINHLNRLLNNLYDDDKDFFVELVTNIKNIKIPDGIAKRSIHKNDLNELKWLIRSGYDIEKNGEELLFSASLFGRRDIVNYLISLGIKLSNDYDLNFILYDDIVELLKKNIKK